MNQKQMRQIAKRVWLTESAEIKRLETTIDFDVFEQVAQLLAKHTGKVVTTAVGTSAVAARKLSHSLNCIEIPSFYLNPADAVHGGLGAVGQNDIVFLISKGGGTVELVQLLEPLKQKKAFLIAISEDEQSPLALQSHLFIKVKVEKEPDPFNMLATASTLSVIALCDALCITLMELKKYSQKEFARIHPAGAVGERLQHSLGEIDGKD